MPSKPMTFKAVRFVGERDFQRMGIISKNMRKAYEPFRLEYLRFIKTLVEKAKMDIYYAQEWEPLTAAYLAEKKSDPARSEEIWKAYGQTLKSITGHISRNTLYVGVKKGKKHTHRPELEMADIVKFMEYGTRDMVARPIIEPTVARVNRQLDKEKIYRAYKLLYKVVAKGFPEYDA